MTDFIKFLPRADERNPERVVEKMSSTSDVTITFRDSACQISLPLHRVLLSWQIPYFERLFSFADNAQRREFTVPVEDAAVAEFYVRSLYEVFFYGQTSDLLSNPRLLLQVMKLKSYFCLEVDAERLYGIKVPPEDFQLLLEVASLPEIEIDKRLLWEIRRNLPSKYSWEGVNEEFKKKVMSVRKDRYLVFGAGSCAIKILDLTRKDQSSDKSLEGHTNAIHSLAATEDQQHIFSGSVDGTIKMWHVESGQLVKTFTGHLYGIDSLIVAKDQEHVFSGGWDKTIKMWSIAEGQEVKVFTGHEKRVNSLVISEDQQHIFSSSFDRSVKMWDVATARCVKTFKHAEEVHSLAVTDYYLFSANGDGSVKMWDIAEEKIMKTFDGHVGKVKTVVLTENQRHLFSAGLDKTVKMWDVVTGERVKTFSGHTRDIHSLVLTEDQQHIFSASTDSTVKLWNISSGKCLNTLEYYTNSLILLKDFF